VVPPCTWMLRTATHEDHLIQMEISMRLLELSGRKLELAGCRFMFPEGGKVTSCLKEVGSVGVFNVRTRRVDRRSVA
jgi:hypothetical protein